MYRYQTEGNSMKDYKTIDDLVNVDSLREEYKRNKEKEAFIEILRLVDIIKDHIYLLSSQGCAKVKCIWFEKEVVEFFKRRGFFVVGSPGSYVIWLKKAKSL